ncbi:MAG: rRNA maturation RNase YbeY, partial [Elusimicrobia bacterium]|nr:rRNA maturation RNase YbeY [Elusimicrobiota bacterium]
KRTVLREALTLAAHGALHLLGHDDADPRARARMFRLQDALVAEVRA